MSRFSTKNGHKSQKGVAKMPIQKISESDANSVPKVALFGTFDVDNYGDCLFPIIVQYHLTKRLGEIRLYPFSPTNRLARIANYSKVYGFNELGKIFSEPPSCFIIGGGGLITVGYGLGVYPQIRNILYPTLIKTWLLPIMIANTWHCPCIFNAVGMPPFKNEKFYNIAARYFKTVDLCLVRDSFSAERLSEMNVVSEIVPDSAFCLPNILATSKWTAYFQQVSETFNLPAKFMVAQASFGAFHLETDHTKYTMTIAKVADMTGLPVVLVPICHHHSDIESLKIMRRILERQGVTTYMITSVLDTLHTSSVLANCEFYIGTSLHGSVATLAFGNRAICYGESERGKYKGVPSVLGLEICHVSTINDIPSRITKLLEMPQSWFTEKIDLGNNIINDYFDRIVEIIKTPLISSIPKGWSQKHSTGEVTYESVSDFQELKILSLSEKRQIKTWKKWLQYLVRTNRISSEHYDHLVFWLRKQNILSSNPKKICKR